MDRHRARLGRPSADARGRLSRRFRRAAPGLWCAGLILAGAAGCTTGAGGGAQGVAGDGASSSSAAAGQASDGGAAATPFTPLPAPSALLRVKNLLTGLPPTPAEYQAYAGDAGQLPALVASWRASPTYRAKMLRFFGQAFQQSQVTADLSATSGAAIAAKDLGGALSLAVTQSLNGVFAQTALAIAEADQPFTDTMTTRSFMVSTAAASVICWLDNLSRQDGQTRGAPKMAVSGPDLTATLTALTAADLTDWHMVATGPPATGERACDWSDAADLRAATRLALNVPRVGFYTTPAFLAGWQTNVANQARVTANQALIVGLNHAVDGTLAMQPQSLAPIDQAHSAPGGACYGCHVTLDPLRQFYRQAFPLSFCGLQADPNEANMPGELAFAGVDVVGTGGIADLGTTMAGHPLFADAWVQKVCTWANDAPCLETDPEFQRVSRAFVASNFKFNALIDTLFSSPLVTLVAPTASTASLRLAVAKVDHLCPLLSARLGIDDACGLDAGHVLTTAADKRVHAIATALPANGYNRGAVLPVLANDPTLFFRAGTENICLALAPQVVGEAPAPYPTGDPNVAIDAMATNLLGLDAGESLEVAAILRAHFDAAKGSGASAATALTSTFVAACSSPLLVGMGL